MHVRRKDYIENMREYFDINLMLAAHLLLPSVDSKDFVDRPMKKSLLEIKKEFKKVEEKLGLINLDGLTSKKIRDAIKENIKKLTLDFGVKNKKKLKQLRVTKERKMKILKNFIDKHFCEVGFDLEADFPEDFQSDLQILNKLANEDVKRIASAINYKWKKLYRRKKKCTSTSISTLIDIPYPFFIPGGRFREFYYWDTFWILEGLLVCNMELSAEYVIKNFIYLIKHYGYIPNGMRKYYAYRSQPPYFPLMLLSLYKHNKEKYKDLVLNEGLEMALLEYDFFVKYRSVDIEKNGEIYSLCLYKVTSDCPRPESFHEDVLTYKTQNERSDFMIYSNLKTGAESGWDFSSKWLENSSELNSINAYEQVPVDLNAIIFRNENIFSYLLEEKGDLEKSKMFKEKAKNRETAINEILWNEPEEVWMDFNLVTEKYINGRFYFSNIEPLLWGVKPKINLYKILLKYHKELFSHTGGIPASGEGNPTTQQWDFPNGWAPHQYIFVNYLLGIKEKDMALHCARAFFKAAMDGYDDCNEFFEKYDVTCPGVTGFGGEYAPQCGFGWTNGTILRFIDWFGDELRTEKDHCESYRDILEYLIKKNKRRLN